MHAAFGLGDKMREYAEIISQTGEGDLGVPAFVDVKNNEARTGEMTEEELKEWLMEKKEITN